MFAHCYLRWLPVAAVAVLVAGPNVSRGQEEDNDAWVPETKTVISVAGETKNLKTFVKLVNLAGLTETLSGKGPYTVFAPTDEAFTKLGEKLESLQRPENRAELQKILKHHIVATRHDAKQLAEAKTVKCLLGQELRVTTQENRTMVDKSTIVRSDATPENGTIHVIDAVLMPAK